MTIIHPYNDFLFTLFPGANQEENDINSLLHRIEAYYSWGNIKPVVTYTNDLVTIEIDTDLIQNQEKDFKRVLELCDRKRYSEALLMLHRLIKHNPTISEYHRILGQVLSEQGDHQEAVNALIDALKWDPTNQAALIMMGNIFYRDLKDPATALTYFETAVERNPNNALAYNNLGSALLQMGRAEEGIEHLEKAWTIDPTYPNTAYGLAYAYGKQGDHYKAFSSGTACLQLTAGKNKQLYNLAIEVVLKAMQAIVTSGTASHVFDEFKDYLERRSGLPIIESKDNSISTTAKLEIAEYHNNTYHQIKYKEGQQFLTHLKMHELVHLELVMDARAENSNKLFTSTGAQKAIFTRNFSDTISKLRKAGLPEERITAFINSLFDGINLQIYNTPIDLFIEDYLYKNYPELRPYQFASLYTLLQQGKNAIEEVTNKKHIPIDIYKASKILNLVNALLFRDLFGLDMVHEFNPTPIELKQATNFWNEFNEYRHDKEPGEEYELIENWAKDLHLENYFELIFENDYHSRPKTLDDFMQSMEQDPLGVNYDTQFKNKETDTFLRNQEALGTNMAVTMFMVDALQFFACMDEGSIKKIALEIAMLGTQGLDPKMDGYRIASIPDKSFSGYHILAYYYVSFKLALPELLSQLKLPYDEEFKLASTIYNSKQ